MGMGGEGVELFSYEASPVRTGHPEAYAGQLV
jgi:hypothetical protein